MIDPINACLIKLCELGHLDMIKALETKGPVNYKCCNGKHETPLYIAVSKGHIDVARYIMEKDPETITYRLGSKPHPIHMAASLGNIEMVELFIDNGVSINMVSYCKTTCLISAIHANRFGMAKWLLEKGADPYIYTVTATDALYFAVSSGDLEMVQLVCSYITDFSRVSKNVFHKAVSDSKKSGLDIVRYLLTIEGLHFNGPTLHNITPIMIAVGFHDKELVDMILEKNIDVNRQDISGNTVLHHAVYTENREIVESIVQTNIDTEIKNNDGLTAYEAAFSMEDKSIFRLIVGRPHKRRRIMYREPDKCHICLNPIEVGQHIDIVEKCGHSYHYDCLNAWFERAPGKEGTCPACGNT